MKWKIAEEINQNKIQDHIIKGIKYKKYTSIENIEKLSNISLIRVAKKRTNRMEKSQF